MKKRLSRVLVVLLVTSMLLASCAPKPAPTPTQALPPKEPTKKVEQPTTAAPPAQAWSLEEVSKPYRGETLKLIGEALPPLEALQVVKADFEQKTGVKVYIESYGHEEAIEKTTLDFAGQTGIYDLVCNPHRTLGKYTQAGWLRPLDDFYKDPTLRDPNFSYEKDLLSTEWFRETCMYKDKVYGLPFHFISMYLWYRYDWFEHPDEMAAFKAKYGYELPSPPVTWKEYLDCSEFFTRKSGQKLAGQVLDHDVYGTCWGGARHVTTWYDYIDVLYSFGGREIYLPNNRGDSYGPIGINSDKAVKALEYILKVLPYCPPGTLTYTWDEKQAAQQTGLTAMAIQWDDATFAVEDPAQSKNPGKMAYSGLPIEEEKAVQIEGWSLFIPTSSKKPKLAWLFLQWCMGKDVQVAQMQKGGESALRSTYSDAKVLAIPYVPTAVYLKTGGTWNLKTREVGDPTGLGVPRRYLEAKNPKTGDTSVTIVAKPTFPEEEVITEAMVLAVNRALRGEQTPKEALDWCAAEFKRILPSTGQ
jgi:multiple sugar transport system substrate-binding protein